jgi:exodeoxyribonuclease VII large subunit
MEPKIATVSQVNGYLKKILDSNIILNNIWIKGEISNFKLHYSGHMYLTLKDEKSVLKAIMFRGANQKLSFQPEDGMKVLARGRISVYEAGGAYQLYIEEMTPDGVGALYIAYEQLRKKLEAEGLFDTRHKKTIPEYPEKIGVITATTGAAVRDIINVISRRFPYAEIIIYPSLVQGENAAANIVEGIEYFNQTCSVDTIIAGRGGGSIEDLWAFNEEIVARAIFASNIPIISAVGHETDFTIADFVSDLRAPTPSAAAEIAVPSQMELVRRIEMLRARIVGALSNQIDARKNYLEQTRLKSPQQKIDDNKILLDHMGKELENAVGLEIRQRRETLGALCAKLDAMSPLSVLARGYAIPMDKDGAIIKSARKLKQGAEFSLKLKDGTKDCVVK